MVLADSSIWIDHFRGKESHLSTLLHDDRVTIHAHVLGELAVGSLKDRASTLSDLSELPASPLATEEEVLELIEGRRIFGRGIGYTDAHLLASAMLGESVTLWTRDSRLAGVADELGIAYHEA
jgi:predicted nucleic acid-binding protein